MKRVSVYYALHKILNQQQSLELYKNNLFYCNLIQFIIANWRKEVEKYIFFSQYRPVQLPSVTPNAGWKRKRERDREYDGGKCEQNKSYVSRVVPQRTGWGKQGFIFTLICVIQNPLI